MIIIPSDGESQLVNAILDVSHRFTIERGHEPRSVHVSTEWLEALWGIPMDVDKIEICGKKVFVDNRVKGKVVYCVDHSR